MEQTNNPRRCILLARTATSEHGSAAMEKQIATLTEFAEKQGMICVRRLLLNGVSSGEIRQHLDQLIARKVEHEDFDTLLATHPDRICRHLTLLRDCEALLNEKGIEPVFVSTVELGVPEVVKLLDAMRLDMMSAQRKECAKRQAMGIAFRREEMRRRLGQPLRVLALARSGATNTAQVESQVKSLRQFATTAGMIWVDAVRLAGVGDKDMDKHVRSLIERKRTADDFNTLLVADYSRLTRRGANHLLRILRKLHRSGIRVISFLGDDHTVISNGFHVVSGTKGVTRDE